MIEPNVLINVNKADVDELEKLPGIGKNKALAIVEHRQILGGFSDVEDLYRVPCLSKALLDSISEHLVCTNGRPSKKQNHGLLVSTRRSGEYVKSVPVNSKISGKRKNVNKTTTEPVLPSASLSPLKKSKPPIWRNAVSTRTLSFDHATSQTTCIMPSRLTSHGHVSKYATSLSSLSPGKLSRWLTDFKQWNAEERTHALDALLETCDMSLVRHLMLKIEPQFQRDFISLLPKELALYVLRYLEPKDLCKAAQTCHIWRTLAEDNVLWKDKCRQSEVEVEETPVVHHMRRRFSSTDSTYRMSEDSIFIYSPYKKAFLKQHVLEMNWRYKPLPQPKLLKGHDDHVITCLQFDGNRIVSGSDDNTLKVWSALNGSIIRTLVGHTGGVWSSQLKDNIVVSGSTDRTLRIWNADTGVCLHVLYGHTSTVRCLAIYADTVVSGSRDGTLRVWDINKGECLHVLVGHSAAVRCVQYDGKRVVSGAYDYVVKVWDPDTETCLHTLSGHTDRVYSLQFDGCHIVSGSLDTSIRVWDACSGQLIQTLVGHRSLTSGMVLKNNTLVSGNADSTVKVWDIVNGQCRHTLAGPNKHQSAVTSLQFNTKFVVTSSDDGSVKLWDLHTGDFLRDLIKLDSGGSGGVVWRVKCNDKKLVCAVGSRNGTEETKLLVLDFENVS